MRTTYFHYSLLVIAACTMFVSCQKEIDGSIVQGANPVGQKPKVGTVWTYDYQQFNLTGGLSFSKIVTHKATALETLGSEQWLKIMDVEADTLVYYLNTKTGGLFQYTNGSSNLFCKYPAALNDTYTTFNEGSSEDFIVKGVNDTLPTGVGNVPANYYEGFHGPQIIDMIWYNENSWIVRKTQYRNRSVLTPFYHKFYSFFIRSIVY